MKYICSNCEAEFLGWSGKCPSCEAWGTLEELEDVAPVSSSSSKRPIQKSAVVKFSEYKADGKHETSRMSTGLAEFDRVLGGGLVTGEVVLVSGEPGVGKSTLLMQVALKLINQDKRVLYVSGEESIVQLYGRIKRCGLSDNNKARENLLLTEEIDTDNIVELISENQPDLVIVDSIQSVSSTQSRSFPGSIAQVRISGSLLTKASKQTGIPMMIVGQITKEGNIAGPKVLEHTVDCVISVEGDEFNVFRIVRGLKNRFGATNEIGVFEMTGAGLQEVENPSQVFMDRVVDKPGCAIGAVIKGSRVVFVEVQALTVDHASEAGPLKRVANGIKRPKLDMICAVLSRRGGVFLGDKDVFVNIAGGLNVDDPSIDLAVCAAIKSAVTDKVIKADVVFAGEVGLTGEVRSFLGVDIVIKEAKRLGFERVVLSSKNSTKKSSGIELELVKELKEIRDSHKL